VKNGDQYIMSRSLVVFLMERIMACGIHRRLPEIDLPDDVVDRFWSKVDRRGPDECWNWNASDRGGYGAFKVNREHISDGSIASSGRLYSAHRIAFVLAYGEPEDGLIVGHKCDNRSCCNPRHLEAITPQKNNSDARERVKFDIPNGERIHTAKLTADDVHSICRERVSTKNGAVKIARKFQFPLHAVKGVLEKDSWLHISSQYSI
jgi:hypothetical protein